jgi:hypothetical protein
MKNHVFFKALLFVLLLASADILAAQPAQPARPASAAGRQGGRGPFGDWDLKVEFDPFDMDAILSFSRNEKGELTADWISFWGVNPLKDVKFEDGKLSFVQVVRFGGEEYTSTFNGTIEDGKLKGVLSGERGDGDVTGERIPRLSRAAGIWELKYKDTTETLTIRQDKEGRLLGDWKDGEVSDIRYERGGLSFKLKSKAGEKTVESAFEGTIERETGLLKGTLKSEGTEPIAVEGRRAGEPLIGVWNLDIAAGERQVKQRLRINPDLSALYGTLPVEKVELKGDRVAFKAVWEFGDRTFDMNFDGKLEGDTLTGEIATPRGAQKVEGKKAVPSFGRRLGR